MGEFIGPVLSMVGALIGGGGGAWAVLKVHVHYLRRDIDMAHRRIDKHDAEIINILKGAFSDGEKKKVS